MLSFFLLLLFVATKIVMIPSFNDCHGSKVYIFYANYPSCIYHVSLNLIKNLLYTRSYNMIMLYLLIASCYERIFEYLTRSSVYLLIIIIPQYIYRYPGF